MGRWLDAQRSLKGDGLVLLSSQVAAPPILTVDEEFVRIMSLTPARPTWDATWSSTFSEAALYLAPIPDELVPHRPRRTSAVIGSSLS
jgi:hypothetical protein